MAAHASEEENRCDWTSTTVLEFFLTPYVVRIKKQNMCFVNKEFCVLHIQSNTTIFYLLVQ